ncbi:MAG: hypothetical protein WC655_10205, partial [Candidatus Hydrogenedentales bacterium]
MLAFPLIAASCLTATGLGLGFFVDDYYLLSTLEGRDAPATTLELFTFGTGSAEEMAPFIAAGPHPWWTLPDFKMRFFRPLSSASLWLDYQLFGANAAGWHVHSLIWYLLMIVAWGLLARRVLPEGTAALAVLLFAVNASHWMPAVWLANVNALTATVGPLFGVWAHVRWREDGWKPGLPLSLLGYATGALGGEAWLGVLAYTGAYELFGRRDSFALRTLSVAPATAMAGVYLVAYKLMGYGVFGSGIYADPMREPIEYMRMITERMLALAGGVLMSTQLDPWVLFPSTRSLIVLSGIAGLLLFAWLLKRSWKGLDERERLALRWMIPAGVLSLLPMAATVPMNRLLTAATLAGSAVVAVVLRHWWQTRVPGQRTAYGLACGAMAGLHLVFSPLMWPAYSATTTILNNWMIDNSLATCMNDENAGEQHVFVLTVDNPLMCMYPPLIRSAFGQSRPASWHALSTATTDHELTRTGENCFVLTSVGGSLTDGEFMEIVRSKRFGFTEGETIALNGSTLKVLQVVDGKPQSMEV